MTFDLCTAAICLGQPAKVSCFFVQAVTIWILCRYVPKGGRCAMKSNCEFVTFDLCAAAFFLVQLPRPRGPVFGEWHL